jgi:undecaprenyl-diphosphatase
MCIKELFIELQVVESNIIKYIQSVTTNEILIIMNAVSGFIYSKLFFCIIIILYLLKFFTFHQFILILLVNSIVRIIRYLIRRNRPYINDSNIKLYDENSIDKYSFPSGHTTFSFLIYFILLNNKIINKYYIIFPLLISFSRIILGAHYISDVIVGIILARYLSLLVK